MKLKELPFLPLLAVVFFFALGITLGGGFMYIKSLESKVAGVNTAVNNPTPTAPTQPQAPTKVDIKVTASDPVKGNPNAKLTIVNFSDYQCPFCGRFYKDVETQIIKDYVDTGKAKYVFKNLAFLGQESTDAANAALCAKEQNKFWEYHATLFENQKGENQGDFAKDKLKKFAADLGLNATQFNDCLDKQKYNAQVQADVAEANKNGFQSTPSTAVGTVPLVGALPYAQFKTAIDAELAK